MTKTIRSHITISLSASEVEDIILDWLRENVDDFDDSGDFDSVYGAEYTYETEGEE